MPRYCYWVVTTEGKKMPVECLQFNRQTESFDNSAQDPFKEIDEAIFADKPQIHAEMTYSKCLSTFSEYCTLHSTACQTLVTCLVVKMSSSEWRERPLVTPIVESISS